MIYVILGQTASGKTSLASKLAKEFNLPLIGADAFQVYKELNIGVAKPTKEELDGLTYHLIDEVPLDEEMNVKVYQERARAILDKYVSEGQDCIMSGGTFLYVRAALYPYEFSTVNDEIDFSDKSDSELFDELKKVDPDSAKELHMNNRRRVEQALRIYYSGQKKSDLKMKDISPIYPVRIFGIEMPVELGNSRINDRVDEMFKDGLIDEVKNFIKEGKTNSKAFAAIGYKEVIEGLENNETEKDISDKIKLNTRRYAKRQRTFLRHQFPNIIFGDSKKIYELIKANLSLKMRTKLAVGNELYSLIETKKVLIAGLGGVGGSAFEGLLRIGINDIIAIDMDVVELSNLNRQTLYNLSDIGLKKAECAEKYAKLINPLAKIDAKSDKIIAGYFNSPEFENVDYILDCIDDVDAKVELYKYSKRIGAKIIVSTGSGLRHDSTKVSIGTLNDTGESLAKAYKRRLKEENLFDGNIQAIYSKEIPVKRRSKTLGSTHVVPNAFGIAFISALIKNIEEEK